MENITFYNSNRKNIMRWSNFILEKDTKGREIFTFETEAYTSIISALTTCTTSRSDLLNLKNNINKLFEHHVSKITYHSIDNTLHLILEWKEYENINEVFSITDKQTNSTLEIKDCFDQSFLPELGNEIENILAKTYEIETVDNNNSKSFNGSFSISFFNFSKSISHNYLLFDITMTSSIFKIATTIEPSIDEIRLFEQELEDMIYKKYPQAKFNPLGVGVGIEFVLREREQVHLTGYIYDMQPFGGNLEFYNIITTEQLSKIYTQIKNRVNK